MDVFKRPGGRGRDARRHLRDEICEELDFHLAMKARDLEAAGLDAATACDRAVELFGNRDSIETACRHIRSGLRLSGLVERAQPLVALVLGTTGLLGLSLLIDATVLRPSPAGVEEELYELQTVHNGSGAIGISRDDFLDWRAAGLFRASAITSGDSLALEVRSGSRTIGVTRYSEGYFDVLQEAPMLGSLRVTSWSDAPVVLSEGLWRRDLGADPSIVGRSLLLGGQPHTVIGVLGRSPRRWDADAFIPTRMDEFPAGRGRRGNRGVVRLTAGLTLGAANRALATVSASIAEDHPPNRLWVGRIRSARTEDRQGIWAAWLVVGLCSASLLLSGLTIGRSRPHRFVPTFLLDAAASGRATPWFAITHRLIPAVLGVAIAVACATVVARGTLRAALGGSASLYPVQLDAFGLTVALMSAWLVVWLISGESSRQRGTSRVIRTAVVFALLVLGVGLVRASIGPPARTLGFAPREVVVVRINLPPARYGHELARSGFYDALKVQLSVDPSLARAGITESVPPLRNVLHYSIGFEGEIVDWSKPRRGADRISVSPGYFDAMGFQILAGRGFRVSDDRDAAPVAVVNQTMADRHWPEGGAIGQTFQLGGLGHWYRVVGVVEDIPEHGPDSSPIIYVALGQNAPREAFVVAPADDTKRAGAAVAEAIARVDARIPTDEIRNAQGMIAARRAPVRNLGLLSGLAGVVALVVIGVGSRPGIRRTFAHTLLGLALGVGLIRVVAPLLTGVVGASLQNEVMVQLVAAHVVLAVVIATTILGRQGPEQT